jgi:tetratricopeptide (TPR) repeat protein
LVILVIGFFWWKGNREKEAQGKMIQAQQWFEVDSFKLALKGDGAHYGFIKVKDKYSMTKASNLCNYYIGVCYLKTGEPKKALDYLKSFSSSEDVAQSQAYEMIGDAYSESGDMKAAIDFYKKAVNNTDNETLTPFYLLKAGMALEHEKNAKEAKEMYEKIKENYPNSQEGRQAEAFIARCEAQL